MMPSAVRQLLRRAIALLQPERAERELAREMDAHLRVIEDEFRRRGLGDADARVAARRAMGGVERAKELHRAARSFTWIEDVTRDARHALRSLRRAPGFTAVAVLTLAIGIGANTAIFSVLNAVLFRPLPFPDSDRLVRIFEHVRGPLGGELRQGLPRDEIRQLRTAARTLAHIDAFGSLVELRLGREEDVELPGARVSADLLALLDAEPALGRLFDRRESDDMDPVIVLSYRAWQKHFGGRPDVLGSVVVTDSTFNMGPPRRAHTVIGVMAEDFSFPAPQTQFWIPLNVEREGGVGTIASLADGATPETAAVEVSTILRRVRGDDQRPSDASPSVAVVRIHDEMVAPVRPALRALAFAVGLLLLIACANVANLILGRNLSRQREMAVRTALGAGRSRLIRQLVTEGLVLAAAGGAAGTAIAFAALRVMRPLLAESGVSTLIRQVGPGAGIATMPTPVDAITLDAIAFLVTAAVCLLSGVLFGVAPALTRRTRHVMEGLRHGATSVTGGLGLLRGNTMRSALVLAQLSLAVTLLVGGGLVVYSFLKLATTDHGYDPTDVLTFQVRLPPGRYTNASLTQFSDALVTRLRTLAGVRETAYSLSLPLVPMMSSTSMRLSPDEQLPPAGAEPTVYHPSVHAVSRAYPRSLGMRVVRGTAFPAADDTSGRQGVLVNEALAYGRFPGADPVGRVVYFGTDPFEILGVVADVRQQGADVAAAPAVFVDIADWGLPPMGFVPNLHYLVRGSGTSAALSEAVRSVLTALDDEALLDNVAPMERLMTTSIARPRIYAWLFGTFAALAGLVAAIGIYGVMAYAVAQSTRDIGIRMALGAPRARVLGVVLGRAAALTGAGLTIGLALAWATTRYLRGILFGVTPLDPRTYAVVAIGFAAVAILASYVPARRATNVDPLVALRTE